MGWASLSFQVHRWVGLAFGLCGVMWCASVVPMSLFPYWFRPDETVQLRAYGPLLADEVDRYSVVPERSPKGDTVRSAALYHIDRALVWRLEIEPRGTVLVDAASGSTRGVLTGEEAGRIAQRAFGGDAGIASVEQIRDYKFFYSNAWRRPIPPYLVTFNDAQGTEFSLNASTGDLETAMGRWERVYRWGRQPHLLLFPPFDSRAGLGDAAQLVALAGLTIAMTVGFGYGIWILNARRQRAAALGAPGARPGRWAMANVHTWLGIGTFLIVFSWVASGFVMVLSSATLAPTARETARMSGEPLTASEFALPPADALRAAAAATQRPVMLLRATRFLDRPVYEAVHANSRTTLVDAVDGRILSPLSNSVIRAAATRFAGKDARVSGIAYLDAYDAYYNRMHKNDRLPLPVYRVDLTADEGLDVPSSIYLDVFSGQVHGRVDGAYWFYRWFGRALHTFDFPWLLARPWLRVALVAIPGAAGTVLAVTGIWLGSLYVFRRARSRRRGRAAQAA